MAAVHESRKTNGSIAPLTACCWLTCTDNHFLAVFSYLGPLQTSPFLRLASKSAERRLIIKRSGSAHDAPAEWAAQEIS